MKRFFQTIANIFKIEDLRKRLLYTFGLIVIYRLGSYIVIPGIDATQIAALQAKTSEGLVGLLNMFSGGAFGNASIFALGVMPYISASIVIQLLGVFLPSFQRLQREGESGRRKMNQYTRYLTILILAIQGPAYVASLRSTLPAEAFVTTMGGVWYGIFATLILIGGTMFVMWLGERITDRGIGNGISLIIMIGIIARLQYGGVRQYIPLKINAAGVMPIIFAQALMLFPLIFSNFNATKGLAAVMSNTNGFWYNFVYAIMVILFTYFYTAITVNPTNMAEEMKKNGGFIPGCKPGKKTAEYIDAVMSRITLPGSILLAIVAILPAFARLLGVNSQFAPFYGGTSLLILVGVILDTLQQIENHLLMRHYDGLMKTGRLKGRSGM